jgi:hypothetical protein
MSHTARFPCTTTVVIRRLRYLKFRQSFRCLEASRSSEVLCSTSRLVPKSDGHLHVSILIILKSTAPGTHKISVRLKYTKVGDFYFRVVCFCSPNIVTSREAPIKCLLERSRWGARACASIPTKSMTRVHGLLLSSGQSSLNNFLIFAKDSLFNLGTGRFNNLRNRRSCMQIRKGSFNL